MQGIAGGRVLAAWLGLLCIGVTSSAAGQAGGRSGWRLTWGPAVDGEYSDNVFLLSPGRKDDLAAPSPGMVQSGRYADMVSSSDALTSVEIGVGLRGRGVSGRTLQIVPEARYVFYARNSKRSHTRLGVTIQQNLPHDARVRVRGSLRPSYFVRNYLADAVDVDGDGAIAQAERVYQPGTVTSADLSADYRFRLVTGLGVQLSTGYESRTLEAPFALRSRRGPTAGADLLLGLGRRVALEVGYGFGREGSGAGDQLLILDEPDLGQDLNGNATLTDADVPVTRRVDLSRNRHVAQATLEIAVADGADLTVGYARRWRRYLSREATDPLYRGRRDVRNAIEGTLDLRVARGLHLELGGSFADQNTNRPNDLGAAGDDDDYRVLRAHLGLSYRR